MSDMMRFLRPCLLFLTVAALELCTFDEGTCQWTIEPPWNIVSLALLPHYHALITSPDIISSEGPFLLAQGKYASIVSSRAISQNLTKSDHLRILAYRYQRRGKAALRISIKTDGHEVLLDTISPVELERKKWHRRSVILPPVAHENSTKIIFECDGIRTAEDVIAVDDVDLATPANVMWAGQDSKFFDEQDIRRRETRRSSKLLGNGVKQVQNSCPPISCQFHSSSCSYHPSNIQLLPTKAVNEAVGESSLTSPPVRLPEDPSNLQIQIFDSAGSTTSVSYRTVGSLEEKEIWKKKIANPSNNWYRVNIPLKDVPKGIPIILIIKSITGPNDFVAFSSIDLVDDELKTVPCDQMATPVQPHSSQFVRLTALQNLKMPLIESLLYQPPVSTLAFPPPSVSFSVDDTQNKPIAVLPISPAQVSARGIPIVPISPFSRPFSLLNIPQKPFHKRR